MKTAIRWMALAAGLFAVQVAVAQAPAGSTGQCKDGTYTSAPSKQGACRGHQGVKEWFAAAATPATPAKPAATPATPATPAAPAAAATPAPAKSTASHTSTASMTQAPGGGPGMVWVNTATNVYHCPGSQYYGKTKAGSYMSEADAKAKGAHADHGKPCTK
jgi:Protein of unknown function (DUF3761)